MKKKLLAVFLLCLCVTFVVIHFSMESLSRKHYSAMKAESLIIQETIEERFELFLNAPLIGGFLTADHFSATDSLSDYTHQAQVITGRFKEILGFNLMDVNGKIINVYPLENNKGALGKVTQNYHKLKGSLAFGEKFWFSPPFKLFQGGEGFAFYFPIYKKNKFAGWIAPVVGSKLFFSKFNFSNFSKRYHHIVHDIETGRNFFETGKLPRRLEEIHKKELKLFGRILRFYIWPRHETFNFKVPIYVSFLIALLLSGFLTFSYHLYIQKNRVKNQLAKVNDLMFYTAKEVSKELVGIYQQMNLIGRETGYVSIKGISTYINYISSLLEQISITTKFSKNENKLVFEECHFPTILLEQIEDFQQQYMDKNIEVASDESFLSNKFQVLFNKWLLRNSIIGNTLRYVLFYGKKYTKLIIKTDLINSRSYITFRFSKEKYLTEEDLKKEDVIKKGLDIAKEVIQLGHGRLDLKEEDLEIEITFMFQKNHE